MNLTFWLLVFVLLAIAFFIIIPPLWRQKEIEQSDVDQRNILIAKERLKELKEQLQAGVLTQAQFDEHYGELELTLSDDLEIEKNTRRQSTQGRWAIAFIVIFLPSLSILSYLQLGEPDALEKAKVQATMQAQNGAVDVNAMVAGLAQRLQQNPDDAKGWVMLGRSYKYLKNYQLAAQAFAKAYALLGENPEVMLHYADALAMAKGGTLVGEPSVLIFKALAKSPDNATGLWLAGMAKAEQRAFPEALQYWGKLESMLDPNSDSYRELQGLISAIKAQSGDVAQVETSKQAQAELSIAVQVNIAEAVKTKANPTDTVFIYAKALTGPPMPLAIVRKQVKDLPVSVKLDDSMAMMPAMKLSNFNAVKVMARISKSGTAIQQPGDYIGAVELNDLSEETAVDIVINEEVK